MPAKTKRFNRLVVITTIAVYFLILVGGIVRNTGSGMGCPDWPKCFGAYIPPTSESQLPDGYQEVYLEKRMEKTLRLASFLSSIGLDKTSSMILSDPYIEKEERFDTKKAWIEYLNRLVGVIIGGLILLTTAYSFKMWQIDKKITLTAVVGLILVLFQGWFGSLVVATNLIPAFVSIHMVLALLQILILIYLYHLSSSNDINARSQKLYHYSLILFFLFIPQILLGTQVRHIVDLAVFEGALKSDWLKEIDWKFYVHRSFSIVFLMATGYLVYNLRNSDKASKASKNVSLWIFALVLFESISGASMYYFDFPLGMQPLHLLVASVIFGFIFYLVLINKRIIGIK